MNNTIKTVTLEPTEFLSTLSIVKCIKQVAIEQQDNNEAGLMQELIDTLLTYEHTDDDKAQLNLDTEKRFAFWLSLDNYRQFCEVSNQTEELAKTRRIMIKFA